LSTQYLVYDFKGATKAGEFNLKIYRQYITCDPCTVDLKYNFFLTRIINFLTHASTFCLLYIEGDLSSYQPLCGNYELLRIPLASLAFVLFNVHTSNVPLVQEPDTDEPAVENCTVDECAAEETDTTITMTREKDTCSILRMDYQHPCV
jgi:hypothetical protein